MTYSPECVAAFEAKFKPGRLIRFDQTGQRFYPVAQKYPETAEAINLLAAGFTVQLIGFAANWERVKELEDALAALLPFTDDLHDEGPECEGWQSCDLAEARSKASKLLEKGNE